MSNDLPLITIITPTYMQGRFIEDCILSIKNQSYRNIEHIVLDANSTDQTQEVVRKYIESYRVTYIREEDRGQSHAINKGLDRARGDIVCWLNSDDFFFDHDVCQRVVSRFRSNPNIDVITADGYLVDEGKKCLSPIILRDPKHITYEYLIYADYILQPSTFWRRNPVRLDESLKFAFDWKFFIDLYRVGLSFHYARDYYSCYRAHGDSKTFEDSPERKKEICELLQYSNAPALSRLWARIIYGGYWLSQATRIRQIRTVTTYANHAMKKLTGGRLYSC